MTDYHARYAGRLKELCEGTLSSADMREIALMAFDMLDVEPPADLAREIPDPGTLESQFEETGAALSALHERLEKLPAAEFGEAFLSLERACDEFDAALDATQR